MKNVAVGNGEFGQAFVRALGLDPGSVRSITLRCAAGEVITVTAEVYVTIEETQEITTLIKRYLLVVDE